MSVRCEFHTLTDRSVAIIRFDPGWCVRDFQDVANQIASEGPVIYMLPDNALMDGINLFSELRKLPDRHNFNAIVGLSDVSRAFVASAAVLTQRGIQIHFYHSLDDALAALQNTAI